VEGNRGDSLHLRLAGQILRRGYGLRPDGSYLITFSYEVGGSWYSGEFLNGSALVEGSRFSLRYDPDRPERNEKNLEARRSRWFSVVIAIVLVAAWLFYEWLIRAPSR
jgi:hypothetical protein